MNAALLNRAFQYVDDKYLDITEQERVPRGHGRRRSYWGVAVACICLILILSLPVAALAAQWLGRRAVWLPNTMEARGGVYGRERVGLSGYQDSSEALALAEWLAFRDGYDIEGIVEGKVLESQYGVYDREMDRRLKEIARKYKLKLHTAMNVIDQRETAYRVGGEFMGKGLERTWACIYEDGTFCCDGDVLLEDGRLLAFQFQRSVKGTFNEALLNIGSVRDYEEFQYVTACGEPVCLAVSPYKSLIYADFEDCFILINILEGSDAHITEEILREVADAIDFVVLKNVRMPEMRGDSSPG